LILKCVKGEHLVHQRKLKSHSKLIEKTERSVCCIFSYCCYSRIQSWTWRKLYWRTHSPKMRI